VFRYKILQLKINRSEEVNLDSEELITFLGQLGLLSVDEENGQEIEDVLMKWNHFYSQLKVPKEQILPEEKPPVVIYSVPQI